MKFLRVGEQGLEKPAVLDKNNIIRDLSGYINDFDPQTINFENLKKIRNINLESLPKINSDIRIGSCVNKPSNIICIGLNYALHASQTNSKLPKYPIVFNKSPDCLQGPNDPIRKKVYQEKLDYEVEVALCIGKRAKNISEKDAQNYVFGYFILNDISERHAQKVIGNGHWFLGKSSAAPAGGILVTTDEIKDINNLNLSLSVNGEERQRGNTKDMIFGFNFLVSHISKYVELFPGTIISTGTPSGTGMEQNPPKFLKIGDKISLKVDFLGQQNQTVISD